MQKTQHLFGINNDFFSVCVDFAVRIEFNMPILFACIRIRNKLDKKRAATTKTEQSFFKLAFKSPEIFHGQSVMHAVLSSIANFMSLYVYSHFAFTFFSSFFAVASYGYCHRNVLEREGGR